MRIRWWPPIGSTRERQFSSDDCVRVVRPAYQGLIRQLDDHLGRLFDYMEGAGLMKNTLIVFTADHGDFLGDHWLGEKELFYDTVQRVPFIVMDPSGEADATRGQALDHMVSVDLVPTVLRALDAPGRRTGWKDASCRKCCMACRTASPGATACIRAGLQLPPGRLLRGKTPRACPALRRWRYVYWLDEPEQLYDLQADPEEFQDLGTSAAYAEVRGALRHRLLEWMLRPHRTTMSDEAVERATNAARAGVFRAVVGGAPSRRANRAGRRRRPPRRGIRPGRAPWPAPGLPASSRRRILPTLVRGRSSRNST